MNIAVLDHQLKLKVKKLCSKSIRMFPESLKKIRSEYQTLICDTKILKTVFMKRKSKELSKWFRIVLKLIIPHGNEWQWKMYSFYCNSLVAFTPNWKFWCCCIHCLFGVNEYQWLVYTHTFPFIPKYVLCFHWPYALFMNTRLVTMSASLRTQTVLPCLIQVLNTMSLLPKCLTHSLSLL